MEDFKNSLIASVQSWEPEFLQKTQLTEEEQWILNQFVDTLDYLNQIKFISMCYYTYRDAYVAPLLHRGLNGIKNLAEDDMKRYQCVWASETYDEDIQRVIAKQMTLISYFENDDFDIDFQVVLDNFEIEAFITWLEGVLRMGAEMRNKLLESCFLTCNDFLNRKIFYSLKENVRGHHLAEIMVRCRVTDRMPLDDLYNQEFKDACHYWLRTRFCSIYQFVHYFINPMSEQFEACQIPMGIFREMAGKRFLSKLDSLENWIEYTKDHLISLGIEFILIEETIDDLETEGVVVYQTYQIPREELTFLFDMRN